MVPTNHRRELAGALQTDALQGLRDFCAGVWDAAVAQKPYCRRLNNATGLPVGADFNEATFRMLTSGEGTVRTPAPHTRASAAPACPMCAMSSASNVSLSCCAQLTKGIHACMPCMRCQSGPKPD